MAASPRPLTRHNPLAELTLSELRARTSAKWRRYEPDVLPLFVAEMDTALAPPVREALVRAVDAGDTGYPEGDDYADSFAEFASRRWDWSDLSPARMAGVPDVITGYVSAIQLLTEPGDHVVVNPPVYPPFFSHVRGAGRFLSEAPLRADGRIDLPTLEDAFERAVAAGKRAAYLLCSPHNPTGTLHTRAELEAVAALADRYHVRVIVDEIHAPVVFDQAPFTPYLTVPGGETAFSLVAASKAWNLAGLKGALMIAGSGATDDLDRFKRAPHQGPSHLGAIAQTAAFREGGPWLEDLLAGLDANRHTLARLLAEQLPEVRYTPPQATFLAWLDCRALALDGREPGPFFLDEARVALNAGPTFGAGGTGFVRLNFATSEDILTEAVRRMAAATSHD